MTLPVYDLVFGVTKESLSSPIRAGWVGGTAPPGIARDAWPRSPRTGFPMLHLLTLELPPPYRRKDAALVGISLFQADDHIATPTPGAEEAITRGVTASSAPFFVDLARAHHARHPHHVDLQDLIGGNFALVWLRAEELRGERTPPPIDHRASAGLGPATQDLNAWDHARAPLDLWLVERAFDPNAGKAPVEVRANEDGDGESAAYVDVVLSEVPELVAFFAEVHGRSHLGGTCLPVQNMPAGLTPYFLELEDGVGGANFGGGNLQLDLESDTFEWAC